MDGGDDEHMMMMIAAKDMMTSHCVDDGFGGSGNDDGKQYSSHYTPRAPLNFSVNIDV